MQETRVQSLGWEDPPGEGKGNPLQYSSLEDPRGGGILEENPGILEENPSRLLCPWGHKRVILSNKQQEQKVLANTVLREKGKIVNKIKTPFLSDLLI